MGLLVHLNDCVQLLNKILKFVWLEVYLKAKRRLVATQCSADLRQIEQDRI